MANNVVKLIVKVGNTSELSFSHSKAYRAVNAEELKQTYKLVNDCSIIIIEGVYEEEYDEVRDFISSYLDTGNKNIWFYSKEEEYNDVQGLADEFELDTFFNQKSLFKDIYEKTGEIITADIDLRAELRGLKSSNEDEFDNAYYDTFGTITEEDNLDINKDESSTEDIDDKENNNELKTDELDVFDTLQNDENENNTEVVININNENKDIEDNRRIVVSLEKDTIDNNKEVIDNTSDNIEYSIEEDKADELSIDNIDLEANEEVDRLVKEIEQERERSKHLLETLELAEEKISDLTKLNKALRDKNNAMTTVYKEVMESSEIIEDPISLSEYSELKDIIKDNEAHIEKLEGNIKELTEQNQIDKSTINELESTIEKLNEKLKSRKEELDKLNEQIKNGELTSDELKEANKTIEELNSEIDSLKISVEHHNNVVLKLRNKIDVKNDIIQKESVARQTAIKFSNKIIAELLRVKQELREANIKNDRNKEIISALQTSGEDNSSIMQEQTQEIARLRSEIEECDKKIKESISNITYEKTELQKKLDEVQEEYNNQTDELKKLETQYEVLKSTCIFDEAGAKSLIESNEALESINATLRNQLNESKKELESVKNNNRILENSNKILEEQNSKLVTNLKSISSSPNSGSNTVRKINYTGHATLIPVFGCGSYGITTMAISMAKKLSLYSKVVIVDFDLVTPKMDTWFRRPPDCIKVEGYTKNNINYTSLRLFFDRGLDFFKNNMPNLIATIDSTTNCGLDYIGGVYNRLENYKLSSADINGLLNLLGTYYDYIVIDLGKLGCSEINDSLIKEITDSASSSVAITTSDKIEMRNFKSKLNTCKININKIAWLLNMCTNAGLDDRHRQILSPSRYMTMPFNSNYYGNKIPLIKIDRQSKEMIETFMNEILFFRKEGH